LLFDNGQRRAGIYNFPLSMMQENQAQLALLAMLAELQQPPVVLPGDFDGDGSIGVLDVVKLVTWVFRQGPPPNDLRAADANGDCTINIVDVATMVNYVFRNGPPPLPGCIRE
ncbi:MAG: hypothetical protein GY869_02410, partial [Planctomycetes bacterium]|nr:hypothetical protein [Planctomycetota bacterium]